MLGRDPRETEPPDTTEAGDKRAGSLLYTPEASHPKTTNNACYRHNARYRHNTYYTYNTCRNTVPRYKHNAYFNQEASIRAGGLKEPELIPCFRE